MLQYVQTVWMMLKFKSQQHGKRGLLLTCQSSGVLLSFFQLRLRAVSAALGLSELLADFLQPFLEGLFTARLACLQTPTGLITQRHWSLYAQSWFAQNLRCHWAKMCTEHNQIKICKILSVAQTVALKEFKEFSSKVLRIYFSYPDECFLASMC